MIPNINAPDELADFLKRNAQTMTDFSSNTFL